MVPVSRRKEMDHPNTVMITWGSLSEMIVVKSREPGFLQSSMARAKRLEGEWSVSPHANRGTGIVNRQYALLVGVLYKAKVACGD